MRTFILHELDFPKCADPKIQYMHFWFNVYL